MKRTRSRLWFTILFVLMLIPVGIIFIQQDQRQPESSIKPLTTEKMESWADNQRVYEQRASLTQKTRDQLLLKDLSLTTSFFLTRLQKKLKEWAELDLEQESLRHRFETELKEHPHFQSFTKLDQDGRLLVQSDQVTDETLERMRMSMKMKPDQDTVYSAPYMVGERQYMLIGVRDGENWNFGEVDLSFVKGFVGEMASVADANGKMFIASSNPKQIKWQNEGGNAEQLSESVPELGWQIKLYSAEDETPVKHFLEGEIIISVDDQDAVEEWLSRHSQYRVKKQTGTYMVLAHPELDTRSMLAEFENVPGVSFAEPNYILTKQGDITGDRSKGTTLTEQEHGAVLHIGPLANGGIQPNDEYFLPYQWNLIQIEAEEGWEITEGAEEVIIAVLDTGVDTLHQDLSERIMDGYNALDESDNVEDGHGHGTHVAGIIGAVTNNVTGIAGTSWNNKLMPIKVLDEYGEGSLYEVAAGIRWAVDHGAKVINMSLGDPQFSQILYDAVRYAYEHDVVLIAAAGNDNVDQPMFPAGYDEVLAVSAVNRDAEKAVFSNYGEHIDVAAPGENIPSTFPDNQYVFMSGTSMAAPHVTGLAGLIRSIRPDLTNDEVLEVIRLSAKDLGEEGKDVYYGYGNISVVNALRIVLDQNHTFVTNKEESSKSIVERFIHLIRGS